MIALLLGLGLLACYAAAIGGLMLLRERGPVERLQGGPSDAVAGVDGAGRERTLRGPAAIYDGLAKRLAPRAFELLGERRQRRARERLDAAGRPQGMTVEDYAGRKAAYTVLMTIAGLFFVLSGSTYIGLFLPVAGFVFIDVWLGGLARRRQERIDRELPDFLDILAVSVSAGVGFMPALRRVGSITGGPLGEEVALAQSQMDLGASRREAFDGLRARNRSDALGKFITALLQAEELGVPLTDAIGDLATEMRRTFHQEARRRAARAVPRVSLVVVMLIVPGAIILIVTAFYFIRVEQFLNAPL